MTSRRICGFLGSFSLALLGSCSGDASGSGDDYVTVQPETLELALACSDNVDSVYQRPSNFDSSGSLGDVLRCSRGRKINADEINQKLNSFSTPFQGTAAKYPVQLYRISYRTTRLGTTPDLGTALVLLPVINNGKGGNGAATATDAAPTTSTAKPPPTAGGDDDDDGFDEDAFDKKNINSMPLVLFAHGTAPWGNACASSKLDPVTAMDADEESGVALALAGRGLPVIAPDYAGYVQGSVAAGYLLSEDEAHSVLDATRAFPKLVKNAPSKVAFVGHSQGGHAALSAQSYANMYGMSGQLQGVAVFAPFWAPGRTLGVVASPAAMYSVRDSPEQIKFAIEYFYTHAEVYDGPGAGTALFQPQAQAPLQQLVSSCALLTPPPDSLGTTTDTFFIQDIYDNVGNCGLDRSACNDEGGVATRWEARFQADRPKLNASGAPIVLWQGKADQTIVPQLAKCGIDKIESDLPNGSAAKFTLCGDKMADHQSILSRRTHWVLRWIKARTLGRPEPKACNGEEAISDPGMPLECLTPPGNDD